MLSIFIMLTIPINIALYFVIVATWISIPDEITLNLSLSVFTVSLTALIIFLKRDRWKQMLTSTYFTNSINAYITSFLLICILALCNFLAYKNVWQIDLTENRHNTLSDQTLSILKSIKGTIRVKIFAPKSNSAHHLALVNLYRYKKNDIEIEVIDPSLRPDLVKLHGIQKIGTILLEYKDKKQLVTRTSELEMTNALIRLSREKVPSLYVLTGHGEKSFRHEGPEGFSELAKLIEKSTYTFEEVDLRTKEAIPDTVDLIIILGPKNDFMENELNMLEAFLKRGGGLLVGIDPDLNKFNVQNLRNFLKKNGIQINNDFVIDTKSHINGSWGTVPLVSKLNQNHPITRHFEEKVFFPLVSSVQIVKESKLKGEKLAESSLFPNSWAERNPQELVDGRVAFGPEKDEPGPMAMGMGLEKNKARIVAFGNSTFVSNQYAKFSSNFILFLNSLSWQIGHDELISFNRPAIEETGPIIISAPQLGIIFYFSVLFTPIILIIASIFCYRKRLHA